MACMRPSATAVTSTGAERTNLKESMTRQKTDDSSVTNGAHCKTSIRAVGALKLPLKTKKLFFKMTSIQRLPPGPLVLRFTLRFIEK